MNLSMPQRRHERHPIGLLIIIGLHVLLGLAMLSTRLRVDTATSWQAPVVPIAPRLPSGGQPHDLPDVKRTPLQRVMVPVPDVIVDRPESLQVAPLQAPPAPVTTPSEASTAVPSQAQGDGQGNAPAAGTGQGDSGGSGNGPVDVRPARVFADAPQCQPEYPLAARLHHVAGITRLRFSVDATGHIVGVRLLRHSGQMPENFVLDRVAMDALSHCPATVGTDESGRPASGTADVDYIWNLE